MLRSDGNLLLIALSTVILCTSIQSFADEDKTAQTIVKTYGDAVVAVLDPAYPDTPIGTGFVVDRAGHVVTNYHVVEGKEKVIVKLASGATVEVQKVYCASSARDLAILDTPITVGTPASLATRRPAQGESIIVYGNPLGLEHSVTSGIVSAIRTENGSECLQIDAPTSPGSSGSPVFDVHGEVVGVVSGSFVGGQNVNLAIAANHVKQLLDDPAPMSMPLGVVYAGKSGARPAEVKPPEIGTPADLASLKTVYVYPDLSTPDWYAITECLRQDGAVSIAADIDSADAVIVYGATSFTLGTQTYTWGGVFGGLYGGGSTTMIAGGVHGQGFAAQTLPDGGLRLLWAFADTRTSRLERSPEINFARNFARAVRDARVSVSSPPPPSPPPTPELALPYSGPRATLSIQAGLAVPTDLFNDGNDVARSLSCGIAYQINELFAINIISFGYEEFPLDKSEVRNALGSEASAWNISGGETRMLSLLTGMRAHLPGTFAPFFSLDLGLFHGSTEDLVLSRDDYYLEVKGKPEDSFGISFGTGLESKVSDRSSAFTEAAMDIVLADGLTLTYVPVRAGMRLHL